MMNRLEPVLDAGATPPITLTERITLSWRELLGLARPNEPKAPGGGRPPAAQAPGALVQEAAAPGDGALAPAAPATPVRADEPAIAVPRPFELEPVELNDAERRAIAAHLAPLVEQAVREGVHDALELSVSNAVSRMRGDIERTISALVTRAVEREIRNLKLSDFMRR